MKNFPEMCMSVLNCGEIGWRCASVGFGGRADKYMLEVGLRSCAWHWLGIQRRGLASEGLRFRLADSDGETEHFRRDSLSTLCFYLLMVTTRNLQH